jgi:ATP-dependent protease HslVU (ClpYQ) peptidase subunit
MTTVITDTKAMACDLQFTHSSGLKMKGTTKILTVQKNLALEMFGVGKVIIGFCGNADTWGKVNSWFASPTGKLPKCKGIEMLMLTGRNEIYHGTNLANWVKLDMDYFAIGSGSHLAMGAYGVGKDVRAAVKFAHEHDPSTGKDVKVYKV